MDPISLSVSPTCQSRSRAAKRVIGCPRQRAVLAGTGRHDATQHHGNAVVRAVQSSRWGTGRAPRLNGNPCQRRSKFDPLSTGPLTPGRRVVEQLPARHAIVARGSAAAFHVPAEASDVGAAALEQVQPLCGAPAGVRAEVHGVGVAGESAVAGEKTGQSDPFGVGEQRLLDVDDACGGLVMVMRTPGFRLKPGVLLERRCSSLRVKTSTLGRVKLRVSSSRRDEMEPASPRWAAHAPPCR